MHDDVLFLQAESLTNYLLEHDIKAKYMHSEIDTMERVEIVNGLRAGEFDVLVGINLLRPYQVHTLLEWLKHISFV